MRQPDERDCGGCASALCRRRPVGAPITERATIASPQILSDALQNADELAFAVAEDLVQFPFMLLRLTEQHANHRLAGRRQGITDAVALEQLMAIRRAGADFILTYFAREIAEGLQG